MVNTETTKSDWGVLDEYKNPMAGMLKCLFEIRFRLKKDLDKGQQEAAFKCLNILAEGKDTPPKVVAFCCNQLGLLYAGHSRLINLNDFK